MRVESQRYDIDPENESMNLVHGSHQWIQVT